MLDNGKNKQSSFLTLLLAAAIGGLIVFALGAAAIDNNWVALKGSNQDKGLRVGLPVKGSSGSGIDAAKIYKTDSPGVVFISAEVVQKTSMLLGGTQQQKGEVTGSGFVIDKQGHVITNAHVVNGATKATVSFGEKTGVPAKIVAKDVSSDVALLKIQVPQENLDPLELGNSAKIGVGDSVVAIGNPFGLDRTVTTGIVSALQREIQAPNGFTINNVIQTDAAINPGNSGGPLLNSQGKVIGVNSQIATAGGNQGNIGIGFAIPINTVKKIGKELLQDGKVEHAFIGISGITLTKQLARSLDLHVQKGVLVQKASGPAAAAGIRGGKAQVLGRDGTQVLAGGDVVLSINGKNTSSMQDIIDLVAAKQPGDIVTVSILRGKTKKILHVKLVDRPDNATP